MRELAVSMVKASFRSKIVNLNPALAPFRGAQEWAATQLSLWGTICWEDARRALSHYHTDQLYAAVMAAGLNLIVIVKIVQRGVVQPGRA